MSTQTTFIQLDLLELGENPGTWGLNLNVNFNLIDNTLKRAINNQASAASMGAPADDGFLDTGAGVTWFDTSIDLLKIKSSAGAWKPVSYHRHGITEGIPGLNLSSEIDAETVLSSTNVQYSGLDSEKLGHFLWSEYFRQAGSELEADGQHINLKAIPSLETGESNLVTVDAYGRITSAQKTNSSAALGLTDVLTINNAATNYYDKVKVDNILGFSHLENGGTRNVVAWADARYGLKSKEHDENHVHVENALLAGSSTQKFSVALLDGDIGTDPGKAMNKSQLDARYMLKTAVGGQIQETVTGEVKYLASAYYDPTNQIAGSGGNPEDYELVHKKFVNDWITTLNGDLTGLLRKTDTDTYYHPLKGGASPYAELNVPDPGANTSGPVPLSRLQSFVADKIALHMSAGHSQYDSIVVPEVSESTNKRNCILTASIDASGNHNWYTISGLELRVNIPLTDNTNSRFDNSLLVSCVSGFSGETGSKDVIMTVDDQWNWTGTDDIINENFILFPANSKGYFGLERDRVTNDTSWFISERDYDTLLAWDYEQRFMPIEPEVNEYWLDTNTMKLFKWEEYDPTGAPGIYAWMDNTSRVPVGTWSTDETDVTVSIYDIRAEMEPLNPTEFSKYTVASIPDATKYFGFQIFITDESGGACMAVSDGVDWKRIYDNVTVS